jgi:uncharacterized protein YkwD
MTGPAPSRTARGDHRRATTGAIALAVLTAAALTSPPQTRADNKRLNDAIVSNIYTMQHHAGCTNDVKVSPQLRLAAQWHADDAVNNAALDGDIGSDGSSTQDRANAAGFHGRAEETVAINPALAINGIDILNQWYNRPDYMAIISDCANTAVGVWSDNSFARSVLVAVYGHPA